MPPAPGPLSPRARLEEILAAPRLDIAEAALVLSSWRRPELDLEPYRAHLALLVDRAEQVGEEVPPLEVLQNVLARDFGYRGDRETYDDLQNADFARVLDRRKGMPIALGILYMHVARALGWTATGLNLPGHFVVRLEAPGLRAIIDPFHGGRPRQPAELRQLLKQVHGEHAELTPESLAAVSDRDVLLRLQNNVKLRLLRQNDGEGAAAVLESMLLLGPDRPELWYESGLVHAELDNCGAAIRALDRFLAFEGGLAREAGTRQQASELLQQLRRRLN